MTFEEVFLRSKHQDCLAQCLSFLTCNELANVARSCRMLQQTIFEEDHEEGNVNLIWQGAEEKLTNPRDIKKKSTSKRRTRVGSNAREHCHLFALASKAAKACEHSDEVEDNRIMVDGLLADLMHVRGFDAEGIEEKKVMAAQETRTLEEASAEISCFKPVSLSSISDEQREEWKQQSREQELRREEKWEKLQELKEPTKILHQDIFVRITQSATGEIVSEGFCASYQKLAWLFGLELSREYPGVSEMQQGLKISLDFESLDQSREIQQFLDTCATSQDIFGAMREEGLGINLTAVVIDRRSHRVQCLFQQDPTNEMSMRVMGPGDGIFRNCRMYGFSARPRWGSDSVQLGPSILHDSYYIAYSFELFLGERMDGSHILFPVLGVHVQEDRSAFHQATMRFLREQHEIEPLETST